ncbi:MAG TPA: HAMP domain-containing sensor histidine kinase [Luteibaculaceae bacterium]|nr:HAMP domain-containing sensor histidine kinase [Luteibaculaceae bacterium]
MRKGIKPSAILMTMIGSYLLLIGFVVYWLQEQYQLTANNVDKQMQISLTETQRHFVDSILINSVLGKMGGDSVFSKQIQEISPKERGELKFTYRSSTNTGRGRPVRSNGSYSNFNIEVKVDSSSNTRRPKTVKKVEQTMAVFSSSEVSGDRDVLIPMPQGVEQSGLKFTPDSSSMFTAQGIRMILSQIAMIPGSQLNARHSGNLKLDSTAVKRVFAQNLKKFNIDIGTQWMVADEQDTTTKAFTYRTGMFSPNLQVSAVSPFWYIAGSMRPQLLFVVLMLLATGLAFGLSYRSLRRLNQLNILKNDLISNMSHELKTPVATVKVALEALSDQRVSSNESLVKDYVGMASLELDRLELLLSKVINSNMLENSQQFVQRSPAKLDELLSKTVQSSLLRAQKQGVELVVQELDHDSLLRIDAAHMQGVFFNLIDNAIKYAGKGAQVCVGLKRDGGDIKIWVDDNGPGIPLEYRSRIYDKFFRIPSGNVHNAKGYGLGLHYAKQVIMLHGGELRLLTSLRGGARFEIILPYED